MGVLGHTSLYELPCDPGLGHDGLGSVTRHEEVGCLRTMIQSVILESQMVRPGVEDRQGMQWALEQTG
jgi:hypothetical protein